MSHNKKNHGRNDYALRTDIYRTKTLAELRAIRDAMEDKPLTWREKLEDAVCWLAIASVTGLVCGAVIKYL